MHLTERPRARGPWRGGWRRGWRWRVHLDRTFHCKDRRCRRRRRPRGTGVMALLQPAGLLTPALGAASHLSAHAQQPDHAKERHVRHGHQEGGGRALCMPAHYCLSHMRPPRTTTALVSPLSLTHSLSTLTSQPPLQEACVAHYPAQFRHPSYILAILYRLLYFKIFCYLSWSSSKKRTTLITISIFKYSPVPSQPAFT